MDRSYWRTKLVAATTLMRWCNMNEKDIIFNAMKKAGEPLSAGKVVELTDLDKKLLIKPLRN